MPQRRVALVLAAALTLPVGLVWANQDGQAGKKKSKDQESSKPAVAAETEKVPYLGVAVGAVPQVLAAQLPDLLPNGRGVVVEAVEPKSPAQKAGIRKHDVLVTYDDQKLFSYDQLVKLVRGDKAGREVTLGVVRRGKLQEVKVKLGQRQASAVAPLWPLPKGPQPPWPDLWKQQQQWQQQWHRWQEQLRKWQPKMPFGPRGPWWQPPKQAPKKEPKKTGPKAWSSFSAMTMRSLGNGRFEVQIEYKGKDGKITQLKYQGTRQEIRTQVEKQKGIPDEVRRHLLRSLDALGHPAKGPQARRPRLYRFWFSLSPDMGPGLNLGRWFWFGPNKDP